MLKTILLLSLVSQQALAAGGAGHLSDLIIPGLNFVVFVAIIVIALKGPLKKMFDDNAVKVKELYNHAEEKDKEAQIKLDMYEKKMSSVSSDIENIEKEAKADAEKFELDHVAEVNAQIEKMKRDAHDKVESEKNSMIRDLNQSLLDEVVAKAKKEISSNSEYKDKATKKIFASL